MKKLTLSILMSFLLLSFIPSALMAGTKTAAFPIDSTRTTEAAESVSLTKRLDEINAMDKSGLNSSEKRTLRKEVRTIKKTLKANNGGIYLSVGAIIIIVLLLILLL